MVTDWIAKHDVKVRLRPNGRGLLRTGGDANSLDELIKECKSREVHLANEYSEASFASDINSLIFELAPEFPSGPIVIPMEKQSKQP